MKTKFKKTSLMLFIALIGGSNLAIAQGVKCIAVNDKGVWAGTQAGLYLISNNGDTWTKKDKGQNFGSISEIALNGSKLIIGTKLSIDNGETWNEIKKPDYSPFECLAINETGIFGSNNPYAESVVFTVDDGNKWKKRRKGLKDAYINKIIIAGTNMYAIGKHDYTGNFISTDNGEHWDKIEDNKHEMILKSRAVAVSGSTIIVANREGLNRSIDNGTTWTPIVAKDAKNVTSVSIFGTNIYAVFDYYLYLSVNNGADWKIIKNQEEETRLAKEKAVKDALAARQKVRSDSLAAIQKIKTDAEAAIKLAKEQQTKIIMNHFKGIAQVSYNNIDSALFRFNEAIKARPNFAEALNGRMGCYKKLGQYDKAKADSLEMSKLISSINPTNQENASFTAEFKTVEKEVNDASSDIHLNCYYKDDNGWFLKANHGTYSEQEACFTKAIQLNPKAEYYIGRGNMLNKSKRVDDANADFTKAIQINPKYEWYEHEIKHYYTCSDCNGKGYKITIRVAVQEVNGKTNSASGTEKKKCACENGTVIKTVKVKSVKLPG